MAKAGFPRTNPAEPSSAGLVEFLTLERLLPWSRNVLVASEQPTITIRSGPVPSA